MRKHLIGNSVSLKIKKTVDIDQDKAKFETTLWTLFLIVGDDNDAYGYGLLLRFLECEEFRNFFIN
jgi:hypothetical protein